MASRLPNWWNQPYWHPPKPPMSFAQRVARAGVSGLVGTIAYEAASTLLDPPRTALGYWAWGLRPIKLPPVDALMDCYNRGMLNAPAFMHCCGALGVEAEPGIPFPTTRLYAGVWERVRQSRLHVPEPDFWMDAAARGMIDISQGLKPLEAALERSGADPEVWMEWIDAWRQYPDISMAYAMYFAGYIDDKTRDQFVQRAGGDPELYFRLGAFFQPRPGAFECVNALANARMSEADAKTFSKLDGYSWEDMQKLLPSMYQTPTVYEAITLLNRRIIGYDDLIKFMALNGIGNPDHQKLLAELRHVIPSAGDLTTMMTRGAFNPDIASELGMYDGQSSNYRDWIGKLGLGDITGDQIQRDGQTTVATWADHLWASSRYRFGIGEAAIALRRLREDNIEDIRRMVPDAQVFGRDQLRQVYELNGVPSNWWGILEELSYVPITLREMRTALKLGIRDTEWVVARLQDMGHRKDRAEDLANILEEQVAYAELAPIRAIESGLLKTVHTEVIAQYETGTVDKQHANDYLVNAGIDKDVVDQYLNVVDARVNHRLAKEGIAAVKRDYINGTLSAAEAMQQLLAMGIVQARASQYLAMWTLQRGRVRRTATTSQILSWVAKGILDGNTAYTRLQNLGWDTPDILIQVSEAQNKLREAQAKMVKAAERDAKAQAKALRDAQKQADQLIKSIQADQRRLTPRPTLDRWYCDGLIGEDWYMEQMHSMGFPPSLAMEYLTDAKKKKGCQPASGGNGAPPPPPKG